MDQLSRTQAAYRRPASTTKRDSGVKKKDPLLTLKYGVWAYFLLLIFEGALRKWILPGLSTPLLIVRDPVAIWLLIAVWQKGLFPFNSYVQIAYFVGVLGIFTAISFGHGSIPVAIFGARTLLIHFPMMFVIAQIFTRDDVIKLGKSTLFIAIPVALLIAVQFYSPQSAFVNIGVGGEGSAGFSGAMGFFRPSGTFSFNNGNSMFFSFVACFVFYFLLNSQEVNKLVLYGATAGLLASIPLSISRSLFFHIIITFLFVIVGISRKPKYMVNILGALVALSIGILILNQTEFFQVAVQAFSRRFESANASEGGLEGVLLDRYLGGLVGALTDTDDLPFFGYGLGLGTNVASMLLTGGRGFLVSEGEWGRLIGELGAVMGMVIIMVRLVFSFQITVSSYRKLAEGDLLPWLLLSFALLAIPQGGWAQPATLGFCTLIGGLVLASLKTSTEEKKEVTNTRIKVSRYIRPVRTA